MIEPRSVEEWAEVCRGKKRHFYGAGNLMCIDCARGFAAQECAALQADLDEWKSHRMADTTGHMFRCAKINGTWACQKGCAVAARDALQQRVEALEKQQSFNDVLDDGIIRRLRKQVEMLHGLIEEAVNGWKGALPHGDDVSTLVRQDRLTCHDLIRKADAIFMSGGGKVRGGGTG